MKAWFLKLPFRGKLYVLGGFSLFVLVPIDKDHTYLYSSLSISLILGVGMIILVDVASFLRKSELAPGTGPLKRTLFITMTACFYAWILSQAITIIMDYTHTKPFEVAANLDGYWYNQNSRNWFGGCHYRARFQNEDGTNRLCVGHIENHKELREMISEDVLLVGRSGFLGVVIDDVRPINQ